MTFREYQENIKNFEDYPKELGPYYLILSVYKSIGKLSEKLEKSLIDGEASFTDKEKMMLSINIGDSLYNLLNICNSMDINIDEVIAFNLRKLSMEKEKKTEEILNK